jgi:succinate-acetate transporter protein
MKARRCCYLIESSSDKSMFVGWVDDEWYVPSKKHKVYICKEDKTSKKPRRMFLTLIIKFLGVSRSNSNNQNFLCKFCFYEGLFCKHLVSCYARLASWFNSNWDSYELSPVTVVIV